jgi:hypothetical protein
MIASRTTQRPNIIGLSALLFIAVLAVAALGLYSALDRRAAAPSQSTVANPYPYFRLNALEAYRQSEWGIAISRAPTPAPWYDPSQLPAGYVFSEKSGPAQPRGPRDLYADLMAVK